MTDNESGLDVQDTTKGAGEPSSAAVAAVEAFSKRRSIESRDDAAETASVKPKAAAVGAVGAVGAAEAPPAAPDIDGDLAEHLERLAAGPAGAGKPTRKELLRDQLAARGLPEGLVKTLVAHGKTKEIEGWLAQPAVLPSPADSARQPSASPAATPVAASPAGTPQEFDFRATLAGVKEGLVDSGLLEKRDSESLVGLLTQLVERQDRIEHAAQAANSSREADAHTAEWTRYGVELQAAREGLAGQFPQVLDDAVYRDRVAPVLEALVASPVTGKRPIKENIAAACRAALHEVTDADQRSRELHRTEGSRPSVAAPSSRSSAAQTITQAEYLGEIVSLRRTLGANAGEAVEEFKARWQGRVKG